MSPLRAHISLAVICIIGVLMIIGAGTMKKKGPSAPTGIKAWGGSYETQSDQLTYEETRFPEAEVAVENAGDVQGVPNREDFPIYNLLANTDTGGNVASQIQGSPYDFNVFKAALGQYAPKQNIRTAFPEKTSIFDNAYSFIPRGLIS